MNAGWKAIPDTPWAAAWLDQLEANGDPSRIDRGYDYWQSDMVSIVQIGAGYILATVEGSRSKPYSVSIELPVPQATAWELHGDDTREYLRLCADHKSKPILAYLADELEALCPPWDEVTPYCTCPDWGFPCKHIAAVWYAVAEQIAADPHVLLTVRGIPDRDDKAAATAPAAAGDPVEPVGPYTSHEPAKSPERPDKSLGPQRPFKSKLAKVDVTTFWRGKPEAWLEARGAESDPDGTQRGRYGLPKWILQPPQEFPRRARRNEPTYVEAMIRAYAALQQGAEQFLSGGGERE